MGKPSFSFSIFRRFNATISSTIQYKCVNIIYNKHTSVLILFTISYKCANSIYNNHVYKWETQKSNNSLTSYSVWDPQHGTPHRMSLPLSYSDAGSRLHSYSPAEPGSREGVEGAEWAGPTSQGSWPFPLRCWSRPLH